MVAKGIVFISCTISSGSPFPPSHVYSCVPFVQVCCTDLGDLLFHVLPFLWLCSVLVYHGYTNIGPFLR